MCTALSKPCACQNVTAALLVHFCSVLRLFLNIDLELVLLLVDRTSMDKKSTVVLIGQALCYVCARIDLYIYTI